MYVLVYKMHAFWRVLVRVSSSDAVESTSVGINYYLHENVVLKADIEELGGSKDSTGFNIGFGYQF